MSELRVGQVIDTEKGQEKIVAMEWGNPVTVAVSGLDRVVHATRAAAVEEGGLEDESSLVRVARMGNQELSQLIKV